MAALMLMAGPASAAGGWAPANSGATVADGVLTLDTTDAAETPFGTSFENPDLDHAVTAGDPISFEYRILDDASCAGGQPRIFVEIDGTYDNSFDGNPDQCGSDDDGDGWWTVTWSAPATGTVGHAGIVWDNPSDRGVVEVRNVVIDSPIFPGSKDECKKGGWAQAGYRNQGQCVSAFASAK